MQKACSFWQQKTMVWPKKMPTFPRWRWHVLSLDQNYYSRGCEDGDRKETFLKHLGSIGSRKKIDPWKNQRVKRNLPLSSFSQASIFQISRQVGSLLFIKIDAHTIFRNLPPILTFGCLTERVAGYFQPNAKTIQVWCFSRTSGPFFWYPPWN